MSRASRDTISLPPPPADYGVVLLSHGSADPRARLACDLLARRVGHRLGAFVAQATLDLDRPRLDGAIATGVKGDPGPGRGTHAPDDGVPRHLGRPDVRGGDPGVPPAHAHHDGHPMGADPHLLDGLDAVLKAAGHRPDPQTAVVLASAGSGYAAARSRHAALALQWRTHGWGASAVAFASGTGPKVEEAVADLRSSGYEKICVARS